ncbi:MAG: hypothetical protein ACTHM0_03980 [Sphingomonas sp.]
MTMPKRLFLAFTCAALAATPAFAASSPFDLSGPALRVSVTHDGMTLPIAQVPNLSAGDTISVAPDFPADQGAHYVLIAGFLRGATNPPPKKWFSAAKTWEKKKKDNSLTLTVPEGARQLVLFLMPDDNGDFDAVVSNVRKQPGTFVRASQELNQASLDRARLDTFLDSIHALESTHPEQLATTSPILTSSLSIKLNADCLNQPLESQAACLTQGRESLLLADSHSSELAETLGGAPTDLAFQISSTAKAGYGYYSPYIGMVRDIARIFGAFQTTRLQYIPAIVHERDDRLTLLLNAAPSFGKPASVMVVAMPAIEPVQPPPLRPSGGDKGFCALDDDLVLPVEGAPLIYATHYAHDMVLRVPRPDGKTVDVPITADPSRGGYVVAPQQLAAAGIDGSVTARLHGQWGFAGFDGPAFRIEASKPGSWKLADPDASLVIGRDNQVMLAGVAPSCITSVTLEQPGAAPLPVKWQPAGAGKISATLPLAKLDSGAMKLAIAEQGSKAPAIVPLQALAQAGHIDALDFHAGDQATTLTGTRLDTVSSVTIGTIAFRPGALTRQGDSDRLELIAADPAPLASLTAGSTEVATITFADGRSRKQRLVVAAARPKVSILQVTHGAAPAGQGVPITLAGDAAIAADAPLTFSFRTDGAMVLSGREKIEIATIDGRASATLDAHSGYMLQSATVAVVSFDPAQTLGSAAFGPLRFRVVDGDQASDWAKLATLVRLPRIDAVRCPEKAARCTLSGSQLFLIDTIAADAAFADPVAVPPGFTGASIEVPRPKDGVLHFKLRDDPSVMATVKVG